MAGIVSLSAFAALAGERTPTVRTDSLGPGERETTRTGETAVSARSDAGGTAVPV